MTDHVQLIAEAILKAEGYAKGFEGLSDVGQKSVVEIATAIIAALAANGLVIVPREPTEAMVAAWNGSDADDVNCPCDRQQRMKWMEGIDPNEWARSNATADWRAMLAAAGGDDAE